MGTTPKKISVVVTIYFPPNIEDSGKNEILHLTNKCIERLWDNTYNELELITVKGGFGPDYAGDISIHTEKNLGNPRAWDIGIAAATYDNVILMDNDVWVEEDWDKEMIEKLSDPNTGVSFPHSIVGDEYDKLHSGFDIEYRGRRDGFCFAFNKKTYKKAGRFLEDQPFKLGYYEDDWFFYRVQNKLGLKLISCPTSKVWHKGQGTTKKMWNDYMSKGIDKNKEWYEKKTNNTYPHLDK